MHVTGKMEKEVALLFASRGTPVAAASMCCTFKAEICGPEHEI
jgi:hypothetical protein